MAHRKIEFLLIDILESCEKIKFYTKDLDKEKIINNPMIVDAVIRNFEIIGEASNRLGKDFREKQKHIDWSRIISFRNRLIHNYMEVDLDLVYDVLTIEINELVENIETIQKSLQ